MFSRNSNIFIQENTFESVVCEKAAILSQPQWVKCSDVVLTLVVLKLFLENKNYVCFYIIFFFTLRWRRLLETFFREYSFIYAERSMPIWQGCWCPGSCVTRASATMVLYWPLQGYSHFSNTRVNDIFISITLNAIAKLKILLQTTMGKPNLTQMIISMWNLWKTKNHQKLS